MNTSLTLAAVLMALTTCVHIIVGENRVHMPLRAAAPSVGLSIYISVLWHGGSILLAFCAVAFWIGAADPGQHWLGIGLAGSLSVGLGACILFYGLRLKRTPWRAPQWIALIPIGVLALTTILP